MIWKTVYDGMLNSVVTGKVIDMMQDVIKCKDLIETKAGDDMEKQFELGSITLAVA